jgi:hypothetical protein
MGKFFRATTVVDSLGALLQEKDDLAAAEPRLWRALEASERTLAPEHPSTLTSTIWPTCCKRRVSLLQPSI